MNAYTSETYSDMFKNWKQVFEVIKLLKIETLNCDFVTIINTTKTTIKLERWQLKFTIKLEQTKRCCGLIVF